MKNRPRTAPSVRMTPRGRATAPSRCGRWRQAGGCGGGRVLGLALSRRDRKPEQLALLALGQGSVENAHERLGEIAILQRMVEQGTAGDRVAVLGRAPLLGAQGLKLGLELLALPPDRLGVELRHGETLSLT